MAKKEDCVVEIKKRSFEDETKLPCYINHPVYDLRKYFPRTPDEWTVDRYFPEVDLHMDIRGQEDKKILEEKSKAMKSLKLRYRFEIV